MRVSVRQLAGAVVVSFCVGAFIAPVLTQTQGGVTTSSPDALRLEAAHLHGGRVHEGSRR